MIAAWRVAVTCVSWVLVAVSLLAAYRYGPHGFTAVVFALSVVLYLDRTVWLIRAKYQPFSAYLTRASQGILLAGLFAGFIARAANSDPFEGYHVVICLAGIGFNLGLAGLRRHGGQAPT